MDMENASADKVIRGAAERMKQMKEFTPPSWAVFVKTGRNRQRPPEQQDWWWTRAAAILRKISVTGSVGVSRLRNEYGGRKNRGHKPEHKMKGSGAIIRKIVQQLEAAGFVRKDKNKGRVITEKGMSFLKGPPRDAKETAKESVKEVREKAQ